MLGREKDMANKILSVSIMIPIVLALVSLFYREHTFQLLFCMGRMEQFYYHLHYPFSKQIRGHGLALGFFHPFRIIINILIYSFFIVVPTLYARIFKFRKCQDLSISGTLSTNISWKFKKHDLIAEGEGSEYTEQFLQ